MTRRVLLGGLVLIGVVGAVTGVNVMLARSADPPAVEKVSVPRTAAAIQGEGASSGRITDATLHAAHIRGDEPVACTECHRVEAEGFTAPSRDRCLECHPERDAAVHAAVSDVEARECTSCHDFADHGPLVERAWDCERCHEHPHDRGPDALTGDAGTCANCHRPHGEESLAPKSCIGCHDTKATGHQASQDLGTGACLTCHRQHDAAVEAQARCAPCHRDHQPRVPATATFAGGHERCTTCHEPHDFTTETVRACGSCHDERALAAERVGAHATCRSCHDRHDVAANADTCRRCHDTVEPEHGAGGGDCLGCHPPHPGRGAGSVAALPCSSCHSRTASNDRAHHGGARCTDCHRQHDFELTAGATFCLGCHATRVGPRAAIAVGDAHRDCTRCHGGDPHAPKAPPACGTCHADEADTAPDGHADCVRCHEPHGATRRRRAKTCTGCHADRDDGPHRGVDGGCRTCHRPHGPGGVASPPACTTCHDRPLPRLHAERGHGTCSDCHQSHAPPPTDPQTCRRCHTDRRDHEPDAASCLGCHLFGDGR
jgi:hypothetical protein